jgi:(2R)-ethylmalonyl-CoA mutase
MTTGTVKRDRPWIMRTYAGHSTAKASNALFRTNLSRGQTGLSVAFDLPTQTGYDADHVLARGEVGKVGVPVSHLGDIRALFEEIPLESTNTSMTINATATWLLSLYLALAEERGTGKALLTGTTQNDIIKEYLSRGTHVFPPAPSMRLIADVITYTVREVPQWNPINICSYHLQEAGATTVQELAYAMTTAIAVLDAVRDTGRITGDEFEQVVGRISFFVNAGIRFVDEICKMRAFVELWDRVTRERYGVKDPAMRRFRYGVQVNSLGLTEQQPENNIIRIVLEMLAVTLSKDARARAVQLPAWNEALGLPRPWDQQWSLRAQQVLAFESDLLEHGDLFNGSHVIEARVNELVREAELEMAEVERRGGAVACVESGYIKQRLVESNAIRVRAIETGEQVVVGVNKFVDGADSPLVKDRASSIQVIDPIVEGQQKAALAAWRAARDDAAVAASLEALRRGALGNENMVPLSIACARAGVTTGEWSDALRAVFGEYRAPTGVAPVSGEARRESGDEVAALRLRLDALERTIGRRPKMLVGKPGLDGHSNGAEQIAIKARDVGFDVVYEGIRLTPKQIVDAALEEGAHVVGLSILSGSHASLVPEVVDGLRAVGLGNIPVVVGGIIPDPDRESLLSLGVARVYTPKDFALNRIMTDIVELVESRHAGG